MQHTAPLTSETRTMEKDRLGVTSIPPPRLGAWGIVGVLSALVLLGSLGYVVVTNGDRTFRNDSVTLGPAEHLSAEQINARLRAMQAQHPQQERRASSTFIYLTEPTLP
jgi:hypothetical protein